MRAPTRSLNRHQGRNPRRQGLSVGGGHRGLGRRTERSVRERAAHRLQVITAPRTRTSEAWTNQSRSGVWREAGGGGAGAPFGGAPSFVPSAVAQPPSVAANAKATSRRQDASILRSR